MSTICRVTLGLLRAPVDEPVRLSFVEMRHRRMGLVEVESDDGVIGYGETWINHPTWAGLERRATIEQGIAPLVIGGDVDRYPTIGRELAQRLGGVARQWGAPGPVHQAISGVEMALWDLAGRRRGATVADLLGGKRRERIPVYASGVDGASVELLDRWMGCGFSAVKCRVGFGREVDLETVRRTVETVGPGVPVYADANQAWSLDEAIASVAALRDLGVTWVEEPLLGGEVGDLETLFAATGVPIAVGENVYGARDFARLARSGAVHVLQPDVSKVGGVAAAADVCRIAEESGVEVMPHWYGGAVALAATLQLAAAFPVVTRVEFDIRENPFRDAIVLDPFEVSSGELEVPAGAGLGIELDHVSLPELMW